MIHPHNDKYVLMIDPMSKNATRFYIPYIIGEDVPYYIDFTWKEVYAHNIEWHKKQIQHLEERLSMEV